MNKDTADIVDREGDWVRQPDGSYGTEYNDAVRVKDDHLEVLQMEVSTDEPLRIPLHIIGAVLTQDGWITVKKDLFEKMSKQHIVDAATYFVDKLKEENTDSFVASHRRLSLSVAQFDAFISLKKAVEQKTLTEDERLGVEAIIYLQKIMGIVESPEDALEGWRRMTPQNRDITMMAYLATKAKE